ncbi:MAG TPA: DUF488 domain-containing protein [Anaerolineales bacterium]
MDEKICQGSLSLLLKGENEGLRQHMGGSSTQIFTIGHSTHPLEEFIAILQAYGIAHLVDVRTVPRSRHNPQFNRDTLPESLAAAQITYTHMPGLGGLRRPLPDSINLGWINESFRGYADYMQTHEFEAQLQELIELAKQSRVAMMCAEAVPWRCHRSLIADALTVRGFEVVDIYNRTRSQLHKVTPWANIEGFRITYPPSNPNEQD